MTPTHPPATGPVPPKAIRPYEPLVPAAVALVMGVLVGELVGGSMGLWCLVAVVAAAAWGGLLWRQAGQGVLLVPVLVLVAATGAARYRAAVDPPPDDVSRLATAGSRIVTIEGVVVRSPHANRPPTDVFLPSTPYYVRTRMTVATRRARVQNTWYPARGRVYVSVREPIPDDAAVVPCLGDRVRVTGRLTRPSPGVNPGAFDVATYFRRQSVRAFLSTGHWEAARVVEAGADPLRWAVGAMGRWAVRRFEAIRSPQGRAVASAIVLGRRDLLRFDLGETQGDDIERAFIVTGTAHFLAVSGFCVGLAAAVVLIVARLIGLGPKQTAVLVAVVIAAYAMMTELKAPVVRATVLVWLLCLAWATGRERLRLTALAAAVMLVLLVRPGDLFTTSFQLSFAVVLGMFWLAVKIEAVLFGRGDEQDLTENDASPSSRFGLWGYLRTTVVLSLAAGLVAVPLAANRFHLVAWLAPVASVALSPLVFLLVAGSMALVILGAPAPWLGDLLAAVPDGMARAVTGAVTALARVPGGRLYVADFSAGWLLVTYGLLAVWIWRKPLGVSRRRLAMAALTAAAAFLWTTGHHAPPAVRTTFVAVGSGNTNLVELPNGRNLLYDAGSALSYARAGEGATAPTLWSRGVERLDAVVISHAHFDHFKDVLPLVERFGVRQVFVPPTFLRRRLSVDDAVVEKLLARGVRVTYFAAGDRLAGAGQTAVRGVWPRGSRSMTDNINDGSLVLAIEDGGRRLLLTGDIEPPAIAGLIATEPNLRADAVLWPHHGHGPAAARDLFRHTGARVAVISASTGWTPRPLPAWVAEDGITVYHTGRHGAVTVELEAQGVRAETFRSR